MRKLGKIKLNQFSADELNQRKMNVLKGGSSCESLCVCICTNDGYDYRAVTAVANNNMDYTVGYSYSY
jgi:natural product precursor